MAHQPLPVNKEAVRTLCIAVGVREAARQLKINEDTVKSWCLRGKWIQRDPQPTLPPTLRPAENQITPNAPKPSEALQNVLESHSKRTKLGLAKATLKAAERFAKKSGEQIIDQASELRQIAAAASTVHGWAEKTDGGINLQLGVLIGGMD